MLFWESSSVGRYCVIELPTVANVLVALDPMSRTVPATSTSMTAIMTAYSAMSWPSCCDHNLCIIKCEFPLFLRLVQWLVRGGYRSTECGGYFGVGCSGLTNVMARLGHSSQHLDLVDCV
jgi:hypothetical protein